MVRTRLRGADLLVVGLVAAVPFLPGLFGSFVSWDDDQVFLDQVSWRGLGPAQLAWMFTTYHMGHYRPIAWLTHGVDYSLWGLRPMGFHLVSILLHAGTAIAFLLVTRRLLRIALGPGSSDAALRLGSVGAALLFAVHPLRVEPVTWLSARADVLSGLLALLSVLAYLRACDSPPARRWYWGSVGLFALALLSKASVMTLPLVLLVLDVYPLRRFGFAPATWLGAAARRVWLEKAPFLALAVVAAAVAVLARLEFGSVRGLEEFTATERMTALLYGLALYAGKTVFPVGLSPLYDYRSVLGAGAWPLALGAAVTGSLTLVALVKRRAWPGFAAAWASSLVILLPVSGLVQSGPQIAADRYTYLAGLGWAVLAGAGISWCADCWWRGAPRAAAGASAIVGTALVVVALVALTAWQTLVWQDSVTLWRQAARLDPGSAIAHVNLATAVWPEDPGQALVHYARAVELAPGLAVARQGLAFALSLAGRDAEALAQARQAARTHPDQAQSWLFLGEALRVSGRPEEAIQAFSEAARLEPDASQPRYRLAATAATLGRHQEALAHLSAGEALARAAGLPETEGHRAAALVYESIAPALAEAAWRRYLAALDSMPRLRDADRQKMLNALASLDRLLGAGAGLPDAPAAPSSPGSR